MGHREDLLEGAKRCLMTKGYAKTTARDIVAESGTNLASIGYHYGSKDALMNQALYECVGAWGEELERVLARADLDAMPDPFARFEAVWSRVLELFPTYRTLWAAQFEMVVLSDDGSEVREYFKNLQGFAHQGLAETLAGITGEIDDPEVRSVGGLYQALLLGTMAQYLVDPDSAPTAAEYADGLRRIAAGATTRAPSA
jgi:AcrR family transcriptional regulator